MSRFFSPLRIRFITLLLSGTVLYFFANVQRVAVPGAVFDRLQQLYNCDASGVAALGMIFMYAYAVMQPLTGLLLDRFGSARVLLGGGLLFLIGEFLFAGASTLAAAYIAQLFNGLGAGALYLALVRENMRIFKERYNITLAAIILIGYAGSIAANAPLLLLMERLGLRRVFLLSAFIMLFFWLCCLLLIMTGTLQAERKNHRFSFREFQPVLERGHNRKLYLFSALNFGLYYVLQTVIGKKFLLDFCGVSDLAGGWIFSATGAIAASGGFLFAFLSTLAGNRRRIFCRIAGTSSLTVFALFLSALGLGVRNGTFYAVLFLVLSATASLSTIVIPLLRETNPENLVGRSISFLNFSFYLAVAMLGNLVSLLLKCFTPVGRNGIAVYGQGAWFTIFAVLFCASFTVFYFSYQMRETYGKRIVED